MPILRLLNTRPGPGTLDNPHYLAFHRVGSVPPGTLQEGTRGLDLPAHRGR
jgi:hypothetical protein